MAEFRNNAFELRRTMWSLVREDWPFFSEEERGIVRRFDLQKICRANHSNLISCNRASYIWHHRSRPSKLTLMTPTPPRNSTSPKPSMTQSFVPDQTNKQTDPSSRANKQIEKTLESARFSPYEVPKGRVAHVKQLLEDREVAQGVSSHEISTQRRASPNLKLAPGTSPIPKANHAMSTSPMIPIHETKLAAEENLSLFLRNEITGQESPINLVVHSAPENSINCKVAIEESPGRGDIALETAIAAAEEGVTQRVPSPETDPSLTTESHSSPAPLTQLQPNKSRDFLTEFTAIETEEQKLEYKELYSKGLAVYREQYQVIDSYNQLSEQLEKKLKAARAKEDLAKMGKVKEVVRRRFKEMQEDARCQAALANFQHLHEKLSHIRMLVERRVEEERVAGLKMSDQPMDTMPILA